MTIAAVARITVTASLQLYGQHVSSKMKLNRSYLHRDDHGCHRGCASLNHRGGEPRAAHERSAKDIALRGQTTHIPTTMAVATVARVAVAAGLELDQDLFTTQQAQCPQQTQVRTSRRSWLSPRFLESPWRRAPSSTTAGLLPRTGKSIASALSTTMLELVTRSAPGTCFIVSQRARTHEKTRHTGIAATEETTAARTKRTKFFLNCIVVESWC